MADLSFTLEAVSDTEALAEGIYVYRVMVAIEGDQTVNLAADDIVGITVVLDTGKKEYQKKLTDVLELSQTPVELGYVEFTDATSATAGDGFYYKHTV